MASPSKLRSKTALEKRATVATTTLSALDFEAFVSAAMATGKPPKAKKVGKRGNKNAKGGSKRRKAY